MELPHVVALALVGPSSVAQHLGSLHAVEKVLLLLLAFGPFVALGIVVHVLRRRDIAAETEDGDRG